MTGIEQWLLPKLGIKSPPWTLHRRKPDHARLHAGGAVSSRIVYPKPDNMLTFDRLTSVFISNTNHEENQPAHLTLKDAVGAGGGQPGDLRRPREPLLPGRRLRVRRRPPDDGDRLQINAQNCVHCKTCDIKDPTQNIVWVTPEGGGGPNYAGM